MKTLKATKNMTVGQALVLAETVPSVVDVVGRMTGSKSEARRLLKQDAVSIDGVRVRDDLLLTHDCLVKYGRGKLVRVKV